MKKNILNMGKKKLHLKTEIEKRPSLSQLQDSTKNCLKSKHNNLLNDKMVKIEKIDKKNQDISYEQHYEQICNKDNSFYH